MELKIIRTTAEYKSALSEVSAFFDNQPIPGTSEGDRFEILMMLVERYEQEHYPIAPPDPIEAIKFRMDQQGKSPKDLAPMIGNTSRVYEVMARTRTLTLRMIRNLNVGMNIPADVLIRDMSVTAKAPRQRVTAKKSIAAKKVAIVHK
ncbi:type II toxin-antitoxin system HigA family antitoxin [Undibacterium sp. 14-3-2]|uniref:helix-turn-helix domain-containing protein n=1 Tax=Undibacterium sp. 14-3-2 TaxID=2800129 RepID=UPI001F23757B|nr:transcriptional regulator [Undibacterium sp. 14-3-2]